MQISYLGTDVFYQVVGTGASVTTFLCGWGYGSEVLKPLAVGVQGKKVFIDFPMFGKSGTLVQDWGLEDYAKLVLAILKKENIKKTKIVGHSFGGKVAIWLASQYNITESLVLIASAGIKPRKNIAVKLKIWRFKLAKKLGLSTAKFGSADFRAILPNAKKTFVQIVNTHIDKMCENINAKTLILAGNKDKDTPLYMQKRLARILKNNALVVLDAGHFVWLGNLAKVQLLLQNFLNKGEL